MTPSRVSFVIAISLGLTIIGPLFTNGDVNAYWDDFHGGDLRYPHWYRCGSWFPWYQQHPAWPEYQLPPKRQFLPIGFVLSVALWSVVVGWIWWTLRIISSSRLFKRLFKRMRDASGIGAHSARQVSEPSAL